MVYGKVCHDAYSVAYFTSDGVNADDVDELERTAQLGQCPLKLGENGSEKELVYVFPEAAKLDEYQDKVERVLKTYRIRLLQMFNDEGLEQVVADRSCSVTATTSSVYRLVDDLQQADLISPNVRAMFDEMTVAKGYLTKAQEFTDRKMHQPPPPLTADEEEAQSRRNHRSSASRPTTATNQNHHKLTSSARANFITPASGLVASTTATPNTWSKNQLVNHLAQNAFDAGMGRNSDPLHVPLGAHTWSPSFTAGRSVYANEITTKSINSTGLQHRYPVVAASRTTLVGVGHVNPLHIHRPWPKMRKRAIKPPPRHPRQTHPTLGKRPKATLPSHGNTKSKSKNKPPSHNQGAPAGIERVLGLHQELGKFCLGNVLVVAGANHGEQLEVDFDNKDSEFVLLDDILVFPKSPLPILSINDYVLAPDMMSGVKGLYIPAQVDGLEEDTVLVECIDGQSVAMKRPKLLKIMKDQYLRAAKPWLRGNGDDSDPEDVFDDDDNNTNHGSHRSTPSRTPSRIDGQEEVLVCWDKDGWYYPSLLVGKSATQVKIQDQDERDRWVDSSKVFSLNNDYFPSTIGEHVLAEHVLFRDSYAPATVKDIDADGHAIVIFFDNSSACVSKTDTVIEIDDDTFDDVVRTIRQQEFKWVGHQVLFRDDATGSFTLGTVQAKTGDSAIYRIQPKDPAQPAVEQVRSHMFIRFSELGDEAGISCDFAPGDGVITTQCGPSKILWKIDSTSYMVETWKGEQTVMEGDDCYHCGVEYALFAASYIKSIATRKV